MKLASCLYALTNNTKNVGPFECHWCASECQSLWIHDDPPPIPFVRSKTTAKRPGSGYICAGCWLWRRKRITIEWLGGGYKDGQCPQKHSWWIARDGAFGLNPETSYSSLFDKLLKPPTEFVLSFVNGGMDNLLQLSLLNQHDQIRADTSLHFTINNIPHCYTIYELESALTSEDQNGCSPGVSALIKILGPHPSFKIKTEEDVKTKRGRQSLPDGKLVARLVK